LQEKEEVKLFPTGDCQLERQALLMAMPLSRAVRCEGGPQHWGKASSRGSGLCMEGVREYMGIFRPGGSLNELRKHSVHCWGALFFLASAGGGGAIRSSNVLSA